MSTLAEYYDEEDPLDYTKRTEDIELPGDLYALQKKDATAACEFSMMHRIIVLFEVVSMSCAYVLDKQPLNLQAA